MTKLSDSMPMALARDQGIVIVLPLGVFFSIAHPEGDTRIGCLHTRAAFSKFLGPHAASQDKVREVFHDYRPAIERLAKALYECPASHV
jgi:hypothetical protein